MPNTNLIYNGDMSHGTECWSGSNLTVENGVLNVTGSLEHNQFIPVSNNRRYRLSFDMKCNGTSTQTSGLLTCLYPYDNTKNSVINIAYTNKYSSSCDTTLAAELKNGDTTVTLTNGSSWGTTLAYQRIGICNKLAWGYNRATVSRPYITRNGNVLTLTNAWADGTFAAGTKVSLFRSGGTYYYPNSVSKANLPSDWTHYSVEFNGGNTIRYSCQYVKFATLGYGHNFSFKNICLECISDAQYCNELDTFETSGLSKQGILTGKMFREDCAPIRYIRDSITGSTANANNHWCGFEVYNDVGEDIAWGRDVKIGSTNYTNNVLTDHNLNSSYIPSGVSGTAILSFDIGYIENISKIKIWHYYPDGRTYHNNITEVSLDGEKWYTVYSGEKPETASGNEIILSPNNASIHNNGIIMAHEFIEW